MKKNLKYLIIIILCLIVLGVILFVFKGKNTLDEAALFKKYDIAITRRDINCHANTIYLNKNEIYIVNFYNNESKELSKIKANVNIDDMIDYVMEYGTDGLSGLKITLKDGTSKVITDNNNIIADFLEKEDLINKFCEMDFGF